MSSESRTIILAATRGTWRPITNPPVGMDVGGVRYLFKEVVPALSTPAPAIYRRVRVS
jgi:hypothetical protein